MHWVLWLQSFSAASSERMVQEQKARKDLSEGSVAGCGAVESLRLDVAESVLLNDGESL